MKNFRFHWGDTVRIISTAPACFRPEAVGSVCGIRIIDTYETAVNLGELVGTVVYLVEFPEGSSTEVPERFLEEVLPT